VAQINPGPTYQFRLLDHKLFGLTTHWTGQGSEPCLIHTGRCWHCSSRCPYQWNAWTTAAHLLSKKIFLLNITKACAQYCPAFQSGAPSLQDRKITLYRRGSRKMSPLVANVEPAQWDFPLPEAPDIIEVVAALYGVDPTLLRKRGEA
jgi:hypothetical protein